ncbi:MAG: hypothetical protein P3X22_004535 [Thermoprotei archaeon]|nr:hypothetical protein [Thermoprotei archaeon]
MRKGRARKDSGEEAPRGRIKESKPPKTQRTGALASPEEVRAAALEVSNVLAERLGIRSFADSSTLLDIVEGVVASYVESRGKSRLERADVDLIVKRLELHREALYKHVASKIMVEAEDLDGAKLEFIVNYAPEIAGKTAPTLYRLAREKGLSYLVETLRRLWETHGSPTLLACPECGFKALTPDFYCIVCGSTPEEGEVKRSMGFEAELRKAAVKWHEKLIAEALNAGFVYYDGEIKPPSMGRRGADIVFHLSHREKNILREVMAERRSSTGVPTFKAPPRT